MPLASCIGTTRPITHIVCMKNDAVQIRVDTTGKTQWRVVAKADGKTLTEWLRDLAREAVAAREVKRGK